MKVKKLIKYIKKYPDYSIQSDSGWEVDSTDINYGVISHDLKLIILNQFEGQHKSVEEYSRTYGVKFKELYDIGE